MCKEVHFGVALAFCSFLASQSSAQDLADVAKGQALAAAVCGACHVTTENPNEVPILSPPAAPFSVIVQRPNFSEEFIRTFLLSKHQTLGPRAAMPNPELVDYQITEIAAYLLALKQKK